MTAGVAKAEASPVNPLLGIAFKVCATFMFTVMLTLIKIASNKYPIGEIVFCRSFFAFVPLFLWVWMNRQFDVVFRTENQLDHSP